jgi:DNA-binding PadR family transcriptional regulator
MALDKQPSSIYDILYSLTDFEDPRRTRLPKLLKSMEKDGLITSALQPGPLGPYRRVYEIGPKAEAYMRQNLKSGIETVLHFYDSYRKSNPRKLYNFTSEIMKRKTKGRILFGAFPNMTSDDLSIIRDLLQTCDESTISILGSDKMLCKTGIKYDSVGEDVTNFKADNQMFSEVFFNGIPPQENLSKCISECKRVMSRGGVLRIQVHFAFFDEPTKPTLGEFIQTTAASLFPEIGIVEGNEIKRNLENYFSKNGVYETSLGEVVFWARKG